jgi:hypothetical protein
MPPTRRELALQHKRRNPPRNQRRSSRRGEQSITVGTSPLQRLPTELLCEIVRIYLCLDPHAGIVAITQVSRRIRQAVLGMAAVWKKITLLPAFGIRGAQYRRLDVG